MNFNQLYYYTSILKASLRPRRLANALKLWLSYRLSTFGILTRWNTKPMFISIEPVNICNLKCPECPVGVRTHQVKAVNVEFETAKKVLDELSPALMHVILYFQGEPLINKNFTGLVKFAHSKKLLTSTSHRRKSQKHRGIGVGQADHFDGRNYAGNVRNVPCGWETGKSNQSNRVCGKMEKRAEISFSAGGDPVYSDENQRASDG